MGPFFVRNMRPRHTLTLYGRTLAPASVGGRTSIMALSLDQLLGDPCVENLKIGRLVLQGPVPDELAARLSDGGSAEVLTPSGESPPSVPEVQVVEPQAPAVLSVEIVEPQVQQEPAVEIVEPPVEAPRNTVESLRELSITELRKMAKGYKIKSSGAEDELIQRILDHEAGVS